MRTICSQMVRVGGYIPAGILIVACGSGPKGPADPVSEEKPVQTSHDADKKPEAAPVSLGVAAMAGVVVARGEQLVLTTCDGVEVVRLDGDAEALASLKVSLGRDGPTPFALVEGERFQRTMDDTRKGLLGSLQLSKVREARPARDGDCGIADLGQPTPYDRTGIEAASLVLDDVTGIAASGRAVLKGTVGSGGWRLTPDDLVLSRVVEWTAGWCDASDPKQAQGQKVTWDVTDAEGTFLGRWTVSCGRARQVMLRAVAGPTRTVAATVEGAQTTWTVPTLGLTSAAGALGFRPWASTQKPKCADERCPASLVAAP